MASAATSKFEDFEPSFEIVQEKDCDTILLYLPGFKKEKLRVQLTSNKALRITGERETEDNKAIRFFKEFPVSSNCDTSKITAKFEKGILYVRQPKLITTEDKPDIKLHVPQPPTPEETADKTQRPKAPKEPQPQTNVQQKPPEKTSTSDGSNKQATSPRDVPQKKLEEELPKGKNEKSNESTNSGSLKKSDEKREHDSLSVAERVDKGSSENVDGSGKTRIEGYMGTAANLAANLKVSRRAFYVVLVVLLAAVVGLYVSNLISSLDTCIL